MEFAMTIVRKLIKRKIDKLLPILQEKLSLCGVVLLKNNYFCIEINSLT